MFAIIDNDAGGAGTQGSLRYFNFTTNQWVSLGNLGTGNQSNALSSRTTNGLFYYVDRTTGDIRTINLNNVPFTDTVLGTVNAPPAGGVVTIIGATTNGSGDLFLYSTSGGNEYVARVNLTTPGSSTWTQVTVAGTGINPPLGNSGDINCNNSGTCYVISNTGPPTYWELNLTPGASFAQVTSPSLTINGTGGGGTFPQNAGVAVNPLTGATYIGFADATSTTFALDSGLTNATLLFSGGGVWVTDMGNCVVPPAAPTLTKTITPSFVLGASGTATVTISIGNSNTNPIYLQTELRDNFPAGMVGANVPGISSTCSTSFGTPSLTVGSTSMTFAAGSRIPAGGCSITFRISATVSLNAYTNTIPAGSLSTTAGSNANAATATFKVGTDFSVVKSQANVVGGPYTTGTTTVGAGLTMQYVLTIVNSAIGGTGSVTFTDTLPILITPVLSITALQTGGGSCATLSAVVTGRTAISGTVTNAPPGATCTVTITARGSSTVAAPTTFQNTVTFTPTPSTGDANGTNNRSTVTTTINPVANLRITKTNNVSSVNAGQTFSYTITVTNLGPANAAGAVVLDPAVSGLNCTTVTYASNPPGTVGTSPALVTINALQSTGVQLTPSFPTSSSATFRLTCGVTGTGVP